MSNVIKVLVLSALITAVPGLIAPASAMELPDQLVKFLPASPDVLVVVPSLLELDRAWNEMRVLVAEMEGDGEKPLPSLLESLREKSPEIYDMIDQNRPLALAMSVPNVMGGQEPVFYGVLPLNPGDWDLNSLAEEFRTPTMIRENRYLLISQNPEFVPAAEPSKLVAHLPKGAFTFCLDLASLWGTFSPMMDVALMAATAPPAVAEGDSVPPQPAVTPEQTRAMGDMFRTIMQSADVLAMGMDMRDQKVMFNEEFTVLPGTALAPPPQPDFVQALQLSRYLPQDSDWSMAYSVEMAGILEMYKEFYLATLEMQYDDVKDQTGLDLAEFMEVYFESLDLVMAPTAMALDFDRQKINAQYVMKTQDVAAIVDMQNRLMELFNEGGPMLEVTQITGLEVEDLEVLAWDYNWDLEGVAAMAAAAADSSQVPDSKDLEVATQILKEFLPGIRMATMDDLMFVSLGTELEPVAQMVHLARKNRGEVHPGLAQLARESGPSCQGVFQGDLSVILTMAFEIAEEVTGEDLAALKLDPMLMTYGLRINESSYGVDYQMDLNGMSGFIKAMEELEKLEKKHKKEAVKGH